MMWLARHEFAVGIEDGQWFCEVSQISSLIAMLPVAIGWLSAVVLQATKKGLAWETCLPLHEFPKGCSGFACEPGKIY